MDKAKAAITEFMGKSGHHDTTVHEAVAPAVQHEVIKPHVHEEINTAIDKEVHQDHYHRTIQPIQDREVLPETHTAKLGAVQHREFDHRDAEGTKRALIDEQARFADERRVENTTHSQSVAPTIGGEHVHHHIHETIQPVVQKETIQPSVVHTTVPIHEVHHNKATHHETTALPAMTMEQFKAKGGSLAGREERYDEFDGVPKNIGGVSTLAASEGLSHKTTPHSHTVPHGSGRHGDFSTHNPLDRNNDGRVDAHDLKSGSHNTTGAYAAGAETRNPMDRNNDGKVDARDLKSGSHNTTGTHAGAYGTHNPMDRNNDGKVDAHDLSKTGSHNRSSVGSSDLTDTSRDKHVGATGKHKPSLMDKLNPKVDSDGDGKAGFMK